jgi:hypothetical protein
MKKRDYKKREECERGMIRESIRKRINKRETMRRRNYEKERL